MDHVIVHAQYTIHRTRVYAIVVTLGQRSLIAILQRTSAREIAARCHVQPSTVSKWASGYCRPQQRTRLILHMYYNITPHTWSKPFQLHS